MSDPSLENFTLQNSGLDVGIRQEVKNKLDIEVRDTNVPGQASLDELLHFAPAVLHGRALELKLLGTGLVPARRVSCFNGNVLKRNRD